MHKIPFLFGLIGVFSFAPFSIKLLIFISYAYLIKTILYEDKDSFWKVYRWEQSGEISGMTRVRGFTQDDAHLFVTEDQIAQEVLGCIELVQIIFDKLGMTDYRVRVGLRDPDSTKYVGDPKRWDKAEQACRDAAASLGVDWSEEEGEAAFYGPKKKSCFAD